MTLSAKENQDSILGSVIWGAFLTGAFSALGGFYYFSIVISLIAIVLFLVFWFRQDRAFSRVRFSSALLAAGIIVTVSIVGFDIAELPQAYGLGLWGLYGVFGFSALQFSRNT